MEKENEKKELIKVTVETLPNGYALTVGSEEYMYFNAVGLIEGIWYHVGLEKLNYIDASHIDLILEAILSWPTIADAAEGQAKKMEELKETRTSLYKLQRKFAEQSDKLEELQSANTDLEFRLKLALKRLDASAEMATRLDEALRSLDKLNLKNMRLEHKREAQAQEIAALKRELAKYSKRKEKEDEEQAAREKIDKRRYKRTRKAADELILQELEKQENDGD